MNTLRKKIVCLCTLASCLLAVGLTAQALADPYDFSFRQGPCSLVIPVDDYRQFHSHLTNTGDYADSYTLTVTSQQPANWVFNVCYGGVCYPPYQTSFQVPVVGDVPPGGTVDFDFDITSLTDSGHAIHTIVITSNGDGAVAGTWTFDAWTPTAPHGILFAPGEGVIATTVDNYVQFHPMLYNAGTEPDSFHLSITRDIPANWLVSYCYDGVCYPPDLAGGDIPAAPGSTVPAAGVVPIDIDFTTLSDAGTGTVTIAIVSNTDGSIFSAASFTVTTGSAVAVGDVPDGALVSNAHAAPNPFNPATEIAFTVGGAVARDAVIDIYDASGRRVRTLVAGDLAPGRQGVAWNGRADDGQALAAGVYLANVQIGGEQQTVKMSLVK
ncbi:MAG TPA: FlgD immunoglobulin-like domain containing protein [Candidatus Krumholzibacteria bacterium]|nr:FlgD immunoglobulin-like domain containing protein [Candidatus Krumholzibacteria bacterium]HPD72466.1 FlgD immunoglobulin-like domain containing protein [Candidatus Krumholzibacteria bacterium]HRY40602.1 FlgD immunoglobulin-like domain containing protein [Candidatus Krumholzibacteria bacterium]